MKEEKLGVRFGWADNDSARGAPGEFFAMVKNKIRVVGLELVGKFKQFGVFAREGRGENGQARSFPRA